MPVRVVTADSGKVGEVGTLAFLDNAVDSLTGTVTAKARFENQTNGALAGRVRTRERASSTCSPTRSRFRRSALLAGQQGNYVFVVGGDKMAKVRPVSVGRRGREI